MATDSEFGSDDHKRRRAISAYYALCSMVDDHVGTICEALDSTGLAETTAVIYTSDHGEALGKRGHWAKSNLYDECTRVPLVVAGPGVPRASTCGTTVNLIDLAPTFLAAFGLSDPSLRGRSLFDIAREPSDPERLAFSEYHAVGAQSGAFMLRKGRWKYHEYVGFEPELFDLETDPDEATDRMNDLTLSASLRTFVASCDGLSIPKRLTGWLKAISVRSSSGSADARPRIRWEPRVGPRRPRFEEHVAALRAALCVT